MTSSDALCAIRVMCTVAAVLVVACGPRKPASATESRSARADAARPALAATPRAVIDAGAVDATVPSPRFEVGATIAIMDGNGIYYAQQKLDASGCRPWPATRAPGGEMPGSWGQRREPWDRDVGVVVAAGGCPDEVLLVDVHGMRVVILADAVRPVPARCPDAVRAMHEAIFPAWDACFGKHKRRAGPAGVDVEIDAAGVAGTVRWNGSTIWGPKVAQCIIDATKRATLDGTACATVTIRLAKDYASR